MAFVVPAAIAAFSTIGSAVAGIGASAAAATAADSALAVGLSTGADAAAIAGGTAAATTGVTAASLASASLGAGAVSTGLQTVGALTSGIGGYQQYSMQAGLAKANAAIAGQQSQNALAAGQNQESAQRLRTGELVGSEKAAQAANGIDVGTGSTAAVRTATELQGNADALAIRYNAAQQAYGLQIQQISDQTQARAFGAAAGGSLAGGVLNAGASFLGGASSLTGKALSYYQSGAMS